MQTKKIQSIAILGGGIGGLASAIFLTRKGFKVTVYDKAKSPQAVGAGFLLQPPGQAILDKLGVLKEVSQHALPIVGLQSETTSGRQLLDLKYNQLKNSSLTGLGVQRSTIYSALLNELLRYESVNYLWASDVQNCIVKNDKVTVITQDTDQHSAADYDFCILASGSNSELANQQFKGRIKKPYGWGCLWTTIELPKSLASNILHQRCYKSHKMMGILPVHQSGDKLEAALYWSVKNEDADKFDAASFPAIKKEISDFWPEASSSLASLNFDSFVSAKYNDIWTPKPFNGRLVAIGDVSHATSPQLGQGCTMALLDAWSLSSCLNQEERNLEATLEKWWRSRRYQLAYVRYLSKFLTPLFQSESKACELFRDWIMAPTGRLPLLDTLQLKTLASDVFLTKQDEVF